MHRVVNHLVRFVFVSNLNIREHCVNVVLMLF